MAPAIPSASCKTNRPQPATAPAQGALAIECRADDAATLRILAGLVRPDGGDVRLTSQGGDVTLEVPGGMVDPGETPAERNTVHVANSGPLYVQGDLSIDGAGDDQPSLAHRAE